MVKLYGAYYAERQVKVILELMDMGSLRDLVDTCKRHGYKIPEPILAHLTMQMLNGLMYLHYMMNQIHRDIKPENILFNSDGEFKFTDFGISK